MMGKTWLAVRAVALLALVCVVIPSCSSDEGTEKGPRIYGDVSLAARSGEPAAQAGVRVTLLRGNLREMFDTVYRTTPEAKARRALIASLEGTRREKSAAYERAQAALVAFDLPVTGPESARCESKVDAKLEAAGAEHLAYIRTFENDLNPLGVPITDVAGTLSLLQERSQQEEDRELRSLLEEYQTNHLQLQASPLYDGRGPTWDRLCWRVSNNGHLNLASALLSVTYNGRRLPIDTARLVWKIPGDTLVLNFESRAPDGSTVYGLEAGGTANGCFFAEDRDMLMENRGHLEEQGLASLLSPRAGEWGFVFDAISVTRAPRVETTDRETSAPYQFFPPQALDAVFAPQLSARRSTFRAQALLERISKSPTGIAWELARRAANACHTVVEMQSELASLEENLQGLHTWAAVDPAVEARVAVVLQEMGGVQQDPTDAEETLAGIIKERHTADSITGSEGSFEFRNLKPDTYTVIARNQKGDLGWIEVVPVNESVEVDLQQKNVLHGSLAKNLAHLD